VGADCPQSLGRVLDNVYQTHIKILDLGVKIHRVIKPGIIVGKFFSASQRLLLASENMHLNPFGVAFRQLNKSFVLAAVDFG
jgi:hypothetical protein